MERRAGLPPHPPGHMGLVPSPMFEGLAFQHPTACAAIILPYGIYSFMQSTQEKIPSTPGLSPPPQEAPTNLLSPATHTSTKQGSFALINRL